MTQDNDDLKKKNKALLEDLDDNDYKEDTDDDLFSENLDDDDFGSADNPPLKKHNDLLKELTNFHPFIKQTVNNWLGLTWNQEKQEYVRYENIPPIMNTRGAAWCIGFLQKYARENNIITNISKNDYIIIMTDVIEVVWKNIGTRAEEFEITNNGDILRVCTEMENSIALVLMGAGDGKYNKFLGETVQRMEHHTIGNQNSQQPNKKSGMLERLKNEIMG